MNFSCLKQVLETNNGELSDIENLFSLLWLTIYKIVVSYCCSFQINYVSQTCPKIEERIRLPPPSPNEIEAHLKLLTKLLKQLAQAYHRFLSTNPAELSADHEFVVQLHLKLTTFSSRYQSYIETVLYLLSLKKGWKPFKHSIGISFQTSIMLL